MIKNLVKVANRLDSLGLTKEADTLDAIIRKLAAESDPEITKSLKRESDLYLGSADPRSVDTSIPMDKADNAFNRRYHAENFKPLPSDTPAAPDPLQNVVSYLDLEHLEDTKDKKEFFSFLADLIDRAEDLAKLSRDISFIGPPIIVKREDTSNDFKTDRNFKRLYDKYGQPIIDALWRYIDEAAGHFSEINDRTLDGRTGDKAYGDLRELKNKITRLRN